MEGPLASAPEEHVELAVRLASDRDYREHLRCEIAERKHLLFDNSTVVREYEKFFSDALHRAGT